MADLLEIKISYRERRKRRGKIALVISLIWLPILGGIFVYDRYFTAHDFSQTILDVNSSGGFWLRLFLLWVFPGLISLHWCEYIFNLVHKERMALWGKQDSLHTSIAADINQPVSYFIISAFNILLLLLATGGYIYLFVTTFF